MNTLNTALELVQAYHTNTYCGLPYLYHLIQVQYELISVGFSLENSNDNDFLTAAILHDILEDTELTKDELCFRVGEKVSNLVYAVTNPYDRSSELTQCEKIEAVYKHISIVDKEGSIIKLADRIVNINLSVATRNAKYAEKYYLQDLGMYKIMELLPTGDPRLLKLQLNYDYAFNNLKSTFGKTE